MNDTIKKYNCTCDSCGKEMRKRPYELRKGTPLFCSRECVSAHQTKIKYNEMCARVGEDFKIWLNKQYWVKELPTREIANIVYGKPKNGPNITRWMKKLDIPLRESGEAIALQWKNDPLRRIEQSFVAVERMGNGTPSRTKLIKLMQTDEYKTKISIANGGENNGMWNPELSTEEREKQKYHARRYPGYQSFRKSVYERDNYTCQKCGDKKGGNLVVHHLNGFHWDEKSRTEVDNGITLCNDCHNRFHSIYGRKWNDIFQFSQYMNEIKV